MCWTRLHRGTPASLLVHATNLISQSCGRTDREINELMQIQDELSVRVRIKHQNEENV